MSIIEELEKKWKNVQYPFLIHSSKNLYFKDINKEIKLDISRIKQGDVVALIGDFNPISILILLKLIDLGAIIMPLTKDTREQHEYFFSSSNVNWVIENEKINNISNNMVHPLIEKLRVNKKPGLIVFSTGTTGKPKAILHDFSLVLKKFETPRPTLRTINFLLFDHMGGINTLFHTLFNKGVIIAPEKRNVASILDTCKKYKEEVLPTTPTFLRMMLISGYVPLKIPKCIKIITYGTERMDQTTLNELCKLLPNVDFRQTFGMSEIGVVRVKSKARNSLYMKIGGEGIKSKIKNDILYIKSTSGMLGYLNSNSPFDKDGWMNTNDIVEEKNGFFKIIGRKNEVINTGGLKFMPAEIEIVALSYPNVSLCKAYARSNPITGQHVELIIQEINNKSVDLIEFKKFLKMKLSSHMIPKRIIIDKVKIGHRYKRS